MLVNCPLVLVILTFNVSELPSIVGYCAHLIIYDVLANLLMILIYCCLINMRLIYTPTYWTISTNMCKQGLESLCITIHLVGGFKHLDKFSMSYMRYSFPLTNSIIFQDGWVNHQPDE